MPLPFEFLISQRPVSFQTKNRANLQLWKRYVLAEAMKTWPGEPPVEAADLSVNLVYLCRADPADIDNIIKPIQDALVGLIYKDDALVTDVGSHRRDLALPIDITDLPPLLQLGVAGATECVYVRIGLARPLKDYL
jgi:crossover junction endodeoxyribonuclease RusA